MKNIHNLFTLSGYEIAFIQSKNTRELQTLMEKCADYCLMVDGYPPDPSAAARLLEDCPPSKTLADKLVIGFSVENNAMIGVLDAIRDYPNPGDWWLGLLLLDPSQRNHQLGRRIFQAFSHWVGQQGARRIFLGVLEENHEALRFWLKMGFELVEKRPPAQFGNRSHVVLTMVQNLTEVIHD